MLCIVKVRASDKSYMNQPIGNTNINQAAFFDFSVSSVLKNEGSTRPYNGPIMLGLSFAES